MTKGHIFRTGQVILEKQMSEKSKYKSEKRKRHSKWSLKH